jgi:hypothetical protein
MEVEILHAQQGDKKKKLDRSTLECRVEVEKFIKRHIREGTALFLERGSGAKVRTYRITGYDPKTDKLKTSLFRKGSVREVSASPDKGRKTAVPPRAGG